ncbi:homologous recombination OB-fold protein isoform X2 [Canis aureus]
MACSLQKLFTVEEEFEDEDFLSAVEDAENQFAGSRPMNAGCLRPVSSRLQDTAQAQSSGQLPSCPTAPSEALGLSALGLHLPTSSVPRAIRSPPSIGTTPLRPVLTSSHQRRVTLTEGLKEPTRPQTSASHPLLTFESQQQVTGGFEGPEQDDFDEVLASMDLELGVHSEPTGILPTWCQEDSAVAKKARVADPSRSCPKKPMPATHMTGVMSAHNELPETVVHCRTPQLHLRSGATSNLPAPKAPGDPAQQPPWEACQKDLPLQAPQPPQSASGPIQSSLQNHFPGHSFQAPNAHLCGKSHFPGPRTPNSICSIPSRTISRSFPQSTLQPRAPASSVRCPVSTPRSPHSSLPPQAVLQSPIVTNHLVQLVTAANRTLQPPAHTKTRRFPGPAGILPHQHSGKNLEEIMVSTPQTPTHGALAKFRTEAALKQLPRNKVPSMAVMIKSLSRSTVDASVVFKDPTGEMQGTVHRLLLETRQSELKPGSVLLLKQVGVFSPSLRNHYLNVTPNNLAHVYSPDSGDGNFLKPLQPFPEDPGSISGNLHHETAKSGKGFGTAQNTEAGASPEEEFPEADDLDGLLSELPEDFFCGTSSWDCPKAGHLP